MATLLEVHVQAHKNFNDIKVAYIRLRSTWYTQFPTVVKLVLLEFSKVHLKSIIENATINKLP